MLRVLATMIQLRSMSVATQSGGSRPRESRSVSDATSSRAPAT